MAWPWPSRNHLFGPHPISPSSTHLLLVCARSPSLVLPGGHWRSRRRLTSQRRVPRIGRLPARGLSTCSGAWLGQPTSTGMTPIHGGLSLHLGKVSKVVTMRLIAKELSGPHATRVSRLADLVSPWRLTTKEADDSSLKRIRWHWAIVTQMA